MKQVTLGTQLDTLRKNIAGWTDDQLSQILVIATFRGKRELISWNRKLRNVKDRIAKLEHLHHKLKDLSDKTDVRSEQLRVSIVDKIYTIEDEIAQYSDGLRQECVHPMDHITIDIETGHPICKFCDTTFSHIAPATEEQMALLRKDISISAFCDIDDNGDDIDE